MTWIDYVILAAFLGVSLSIGVYHALAGGRQRTTSEFIMADRQLKVLPTALSLFVSFQSAIVILGTTAEMYSYGVQLMIMGPISVLIGIVVAERLFVPWMFELKLVSVNEYFERRFRSKSVRVLGSLFSLSAGIIYMGVAMFAPSAALQAAVGFPIQLSIPLMAIVCIAYTALGGMKAVIWTDVFQCFIMLGGIIAILIKGTIVVGGVGRVFELCAEEGRLKWIDWSFDPTVRHTFWGFLFGYSVNYLYSYGTAQPSVQRFSSTQSLRAARLAVLISIPSLFLLYVMLSMLGLTVVAYYSSIACDPIGQSQVSSPNQILPHFVMTLFADDPGFSGLFLATLYGGALSSVSSALSGTAANCWGDLLEWKFAHMSESAKAAINRAIVVVFGFMATGIAYLASIAPGTLSQVSWAFGGSVGGPLFGLFVLGGISRRSNWIGALVGALTAFSFNAWLNVGSLRSTRLPATLPVMSISGCQGTDNITEFTMTSVTWQLLSSEQNHSAYNNSELTPAVEMSVLETVYSLSYMWYIPMSATLTVILGLVVSLFTGNAEDERCVDDNTLFNFKRVFTFNFADEKNLNCEDRSHQSLQDVRSDDPFEIEDDNLKGDRDDVITERKYRDGKTHPQMSEYYF